MSADLYHKLRRIDRMQNAMKLRLAQADQRRAAETLPVCPDCGERHPPSPLAALFKHLAEDATPPAPTQPKEPSRGHH